MENILEIYNQIYKKNKLFGVDVQLKQNPFLKANRRPYSVAICGGVFGDEGKGRVIDELTALLLKKSKQVILYRDNGGSNAGHTVEIDKIKLALHQLGSGVFIKNAITISGKGMVIHPADMVLEIQQVMKLCGGKIPARVIIDEMAFVCLDTHRAFEQALSIANNGYSSSTGRGISPAYADILYRQPLRMRDLIKPDWKKAVAKHYQYYQKLILGLGMDMKSLLVPQLTKNTRKVGSQATFISRLDSAMQFLKPFIKDAHLLISKLWSNQTPFVFEKAQAIGLDINWSVYPDCTVSDCTFNGIHSSTEGLVDPNEIAIKAAVIKATYSSSVGSRIMPSQMHEKLAEKIRHVANEYGATTGRPRDIHYLDIPLLSYLMRVGRVEYLVPTHLDIVFPNTPIKVCIGYKKAGKLVDYRPDQEYLLGIKPVFLELPTWDAQAAAKAKMPHQLPKEAQQFLAFLKETLSVELLMATTGPKRHQTVSWMSSYYK